MPKFYIMTMDERKKIVVDAPTPQDAIRKLRLALKPSLYVYVNERGFNKGRTLKV